jgi:hypothetical protein
MEAAIIFEIAINALQPHYDRGFVFLLGSRYFTVCPLEHLPDIG